MKEKNIPKSKTYSPLITAVLIGVGSMLLISKNNKEGLIIFSISALVLLAAIAIAYRQRVNFKFFMITVWISLSLGLLKVFIELLH